MTVSDEAKGESRPFEADVAKLLHMMVHSVYSEKEVFLRELISNAADACERLRYEAIANPGLLGEDPSPRITIGIDADKRQLTVEDNGRGFESSPENATSDGLRNMRQRMEDISGDFSVSPVPEGGTLVRLTAPLGKR